MRLRSCAPRPCRLRVFLRFLFEDGLVWYPWRWPLGWRLAGRVCAIEQERRIHDPITRNWDTPEEDEAWKDL